MSSPITVSNSTFGPDDLIAGRYRVVRFLAAGGMGEVYEVHDEHLDERLALKTVRRDVQPAHGGAVDLLERFEEEIRIARRVTHRNVCRVFDAGRHDLVDGEPILYLTMELLEGETLADRIRDRGRFAVEAALPIVKQLAFALDAAHREGIVHRDFKSGNILLESDGRAVVTDFGLAGAIGAEHAFEGASSSTISGTVAFMAPEQVGGGGLGPEADLYSLGVVLYQMMTGEVPFSASTPLGAAVKRLREDAPPPLDLAPDLPAGWNAAILRLLAREPSERFASGRELIDALEGRGATRRKGTLAGATATALAVLAVGAFFFVSLDEAPTTVVLVGQGDPRQLTSDPGLEIDPSFSPDGRRLSFATDRSGGFEVVVRSLTAGSEDLQLTKDGTQNVQPAWSPDGQTIAFVSLQRDGVFLVPSDGGATRRLTSFGSRPAWSPDGRSIVFQEDSRHEIAERSIPALPPSVLWQVSTDGGSPVRLTEPGEPQGGHGEPAWHPGGDWLFFSVGSRRRTAIWGLATARGEAPMPLVVDARIAMHPRPTPDGKGLVWVGVAADRKGAASYAAWWSAFDPVAGMLLGEPRRLSGFGLATPRQPALAPDGSQMVWSTLTTSSQLVSLSLDDEGLPSGDPQALTAGSVRNSRPVISSDGKGVAHDRWQVGSNLDIWWLGLDDGDRTALTVDQGWDSQPTWLDDGRVAWFSDRGGERRIWVLDRSTGRREPLGPTSVLDSEIDWARTSPDGQRVVFHRRAEGGGLDVWVRDLTTGEELRLTEDPEMAAFPVWSPDGRWIAFESRRDGSTHVCVVAAEGGEMRQLTNEAGESWPFSFSPDGDRVAFTAQRGTRWSLRSVSRSTGEERVLVEESRLAAYVRYPALSPTGNRLVFERSETAGDLWSLDLETVSETGAD